MIANYHTHTARCGHATGEDRDYVEQALARGLKVLGFSDHVPMPFADGHESHFRIPRARLGDYVESVLALREEYKDRIRILLGFEAEYYPDYMERVEEMLAPYPVDYMILGQHFNSSQELTYNPRPQEDEGALIQYVDRVLEGLASGRYLYLAHPDLFYFVGDQALYQREMTRLCRGAEELNIPLELNMLGMREKKGYPRPFFWEIAARTGNRCIIGCDAHSPADVADPEQLANIEAFARQAGIREENIIREAF